jgi:pimeloyl-ACP methyl ester carboxylesterase
MSHFRSFSSQPSSFVAAGARRTEARQIVLTMVQDNGEMSNKVSLEVRRKVVHIHGWETDTFSIDYYRQQTIGEDRRTHHSADNAISAGSPSPSSTANTFNPIHADYYIIFVPGNPGLIEWYIDFFRELVQRLGVRFAARGIANAGHSLDLIEREEQHLKQIGGEHKSQNSGRTRDSALWPVPWTVDGQAMHKAAYVRTLLQEIPRSSKLIIVGHSIGCHFSQRMCVVYPQILQRTVLFLYLMPFIRMDAPVHWQTLGDFLVQHPKAAILPYATIMRLARLLPDSVLHYIMSKSVKDDAGRQVAIHLSRIPRFATYFFRLGLEEVRDVPQVIDVAGLSSLTHNGNSHIAFLYAGDDHWGPDFHVSELRSVIVANKALRDKCTVEQNTRLRHDFVTDPAQVPVVVDFCCRRIMQAIKSELLIQSRL